MTERPPLHQRCFTSEAVETEIDRVRARIADEELGRLFANALPNTLTDTLPFDGEGWPARPNGLIRSGFRP